MGSLRQNTFTRIEEVAFRVYTDKEIEKMSVVNVTSDASMNSLGHYLENGIYDLRMGPMNATDDSCHTCRNKFSYCCGHYGHIDLPLPLCNPFFYDIIKEILGRVCPACCRYQVKEQRGIQFIYECQLFSAGYHLQALEVADIVSHFMNEPEEAVEVHISVNNSEVSQSAAILHTCIALEKKLRKMFKMLKKGEAPSKIVTCNSQAIYTQLQRNFLQDTRLKAGKNCMYCPKKLLNLRFQNSQILIKNSVKNCKEDNCDTSSEPAVSRSQPYLTSKQAQKILRECFKQDGVILRHLYPFLLNSDMENPVDMLFLKKLLVIPPKHRPNNYVNGLIIESELSVLYKSVLRLCKCLRFIVQHIDEVPSQLPETLRFLLSEFQGATMLQKSHNVWHQLQGAVDNILDSELSPNLKVVHKGIRQVIEKKLGLFRQNLMGKRVDFSARSVAAPDAMLAVDEVGVPLDFALKLTYPVPVTHWNVPKLRKLVQNGPLTYPGALMVEDEEGRKITLSAKDASQRNTIASSLLTPVESCARRVNATKIVYRHLQTGDYILMNRQPTLHKPSIQAHRALVIPRDRVLRLPYASCKAYNADFDGDELNLHFPQNEMARSEAHYLMTSRNQYLTPKDGSPLAGLIQDCVVAGVMLTVRGKFFSAEDYQQLVYVGLSQLPRKILMLPPAIQKPRRLWSGKQIISTILLNLIPDEKVLPSFQFKTTVKVELWQTREPKMWECGGIPERRKESMTESEFVMRDGELLCGVLDKCAIGSTSYGMVHTYFELYGGAVASQVLTSISRVCIWFLQWSGHTISLKEFVTCPEAASRRRRDLKKLIENAEAEVKLKLDLPEETALAEHVELLHKSENEIELAIVDAAYTSVLGPPTTSITKENEKNLCRSNLKNRMRMMVDTGAKGSKVNMNQMASLFGSVALDGKRMPMSITGKTLPVYKPYETNPKAGGYIPTRFVTGMDPKSYYFLCIVGRDSLQHTAVKTANSGYMQRCLIKHLEGIHVKYDMTVRNSDGMVLQFQYGEDGLDVSKVPFLKNLDSANILMDNYWRCLEKKRMDIAMASQSTEIDAYKQWAAKYKQKGRKGTRSSAFLRFCKSQKGETLTSLKIDPYSRTAESLQMISMWNHLKPEEKVIYELPDIKLKRGRDPVSSFFSGASNFRVVSEAMDTLIDEYYNQMYLQRRLEERPLPKEEVANTFYMKSMNSRVDPGEAVGALCAQAIGEPLTQMTLNTFHFAGKDELNVTLGVPRMIEILRCASEEIKTPIMEVPFRPHVLPRVAHRLRVKFSPVILDQVINSVNIWTSLEKGVKLFRRTAIQFNFLSYSKYKKTLFVKPSDILEFMEKTFIKKVLIAQIRAAIKQVGIFGASSIRNRKLGEPKDDEDENVTEPEPNTQNRGLEEEGNELSEEEEQQNQDNDVSSASRHRKMKERDYSEDEEEENDIEIAAFGSEIPQEEKEKEENDIQKKIRKTVMNPIDDIMGSEGEGLGDDLVNVEEEEDQNQVEMKKEKTTTQKSNKVSTILNQDDIDYICRRNQVSSQDAWIVDYDFDKDDMQWCAVTLNLPLAEGRYDLASILQKITKNTLLHSTPGIKKAYVVPREDHLLLKTEGVNIRRLYAYENLLDIDKLYTNNIHLMAKMYGIEAAQRCIIKEIKEVQSAYDIKVDFRHLTLLADYFTCEGVYKACSRHAISTCSSPIQKMSYETCFNFLKNALVQGLPDNMSSPSANIMVGQPIKVGTNSVDILSRLADVH